MLKPGGVKTISSETSQTTANASFNSGAAYALAAYAFWNVAPIYFVWVQFALPLEVLAQRIIWSVPLLALCITFTRQWRAVFALNAKQLRSLLLAAVLLSINWLTFIYAIFANKIAETSLGYFINPLLTIVLGAVLLNEHLRPWQWVAAAIAALGVGIELVMQGTVPVYALVLALTFGVYGVIKKQMQLPSTVGLGVETALVAPVALGYIIWLFALGSGEPRNIEQLGLLALGGVVTALPLVLFGAAAVRLPLTILGFFQYLAPSISLWIAIFVYGESVTTARWIAFGLVWTALVLLSIEGLMANRKSSVLRAS